MERFRNGKIFAQTDDHSAQICLRWVERNESDSRYCLVALPSIAVVQVVPSCDISYL